uniref:G-protein coupled receptors family 1 profile domain-containing protein n=1 Tax=Cavia porcellus TaxID=10141 RepID=A0A286XTE3_CAVPO|nr:olfactory receptor 51G2-like [Cavia porcellus]
MEADRARVSLGGVWVIKVLSSHVRCQPQSSPSSLQVTASHFQSRLRWGREARRPGGTVDRGARTRSGEGARGTPGSSRRLAGRSNSNLARERGPQHRPGYLGEPAPLTFLGSRYRGRALGGARRGGREEERKGEAELRPLQGRAGEREDRAGGPRSPSLRRCAAATEPQLGTRPPGNLQDGRDDAAFPDTVGYPASRRCCPKRLLPCHHPLLTDGHITNYTWVWSPRSLKWKSGFQGRGGQLPSGITVFSCNTSTSGHSIFLLTGFPGLEVSQHWVSIPINLICVVSIVGNSIILFVIRTEPVLHQPMYIFLSMLAASDLGLSVSTFPTMVKLFWLGVRELPFDLCAAQMFFIHAFTYVESGVLLAMAFDRFIAIQDPLHYATILPNSSVAKMGAAILVRAVLLNLPGPILLRNLLFPQISELSHCYCLHCDLVGLACSDIQINSLVGLVSILFSLGLDSSLIVLSYALILRTVLGTASPGKRLKALSTCASHLCIVLIFYLPKLGLSVLHRVEKRSYPALAVLMANLHFLVPPLMNPIVYCIKSKQIRQGFLKHFQQKRIDAS